MYPCMFSDAEVVEEQLLIVKILNGCMKTILHFCNFMENATGCENLMFKERRFRTDQDMKVISIRREGKTLLRWEMNHLA